EALADRIERQLQEAGEREVTSRAVGESVMRELHALDAVAYVRFASVYRSFRDVHEFMRELEDLIAERRTPARRGRPRRPAPRRRACAAGAVRGRRTRASGRVRLRSLPGAWGALSRPRRWERSSSATAAWSARGSTVAPVRRTRRSRRCGRRASA